jgi:hypothetical protein
MINIYFFSSDSFTGSDQSPRENNFVSRGKGDSSKTIRRNETARKKI